MSEQTFFWHHVAPMKLYSNSKGIRHSAIWMLLIVLLTTTAGCNSTRRDIAIDEEVKVGQRTFSFEEAQKFDMMSSYRIAPGDILDVLFQIRTWIEKPDFKIAADHTVAVNFVHTPELNTKELVRPNGMISLPYIGEFYVIGKSPKELESELKKAYTGILREPEIFVQVPEFQSAIMEVKKDLHTAPRGLSRLTTVHPDGYVTFPMLGEILVAGRTIKDVNNELNQRYEQIITGLHVDLFLEKHAGSLVYVLGAVEKPGGFIIGKPISVAQALALAGSFKNEAELSSVVVTRRHQGTMVATRLDLTLSAELGGRGDLFFLMPDDIVFVPRTRLSEAAQVGEEIRQALISRGWGANLSLDSIVWDDQNN
jgi:polysaccharide export outer membrane protein